MRLFQPLPPPTADRRPPTRSRRSSAGFTLLEMMVSVALVLVLMLAVTRIFSIASQTVGASQALSAGTRDAKAAQAVFTRDLSALDPNSALLAIYSNATYGYRSQVEAQADRDGNIDTIDLNGDGTEDPTEKVSYAAVNSRRHRIDTISFFARDRFSRQTGNQNFIDNATSNEAFIHYGHAKQPDNSGAFATAQQPGAGTPFGNPNNFFSTQWTLARTAILLSDAIPVTTPPTPHFARIGSVATNPTGALNLVTGLSTPDYKGDVFEITRSRFDLARTTIEAFKSDVRLVVARFNSDGTNNTAYRADWWEPVVLADPAIVPREPSRFFVKPFITRPYNSEGLAYTVPAFVQGCTQFIVEFAGDYVTQNPVSGVPTAATPDGILDYVQLAPGANSLRQIRWYGHPRKTTTATAGIVAANGDVAPLAATTGTSAYVFDKSTGEFSRPNADWTTVTPAADDYVCMVWGPAEMAQRPRMLRITLAIDRPEAQGRLDSGQTFEYVFTLP